MPCSCRPKMDPFTAAGGGSTSWKHGTMWLGLYTSVAHASFHSKLLLLCLQMHEAGSPLPFSSSSSWSEPTRLFFLLLLNPFQHLKLKGIYETMLFVFFSVSHDQESFCYGSTNDMCTKQWSDDRRL